MEGIGLSIDLVCPACGQANKETASFCRECGTRLAAVPPVAKPQTVAFTPVSNAPQSRSAHRRAGRGVVIGAAVVAVLGAAVLAAWLGNWPQPLFGPPTSDVSGPEAAVSMRARPAAQESSVPTSSSTVGSGPATSASPPASNGDSPAAIDEVTPQLAASQTDGSVKDYSGVYTTVGGVIVQAQVQETN